MWPQGGPAQLSFPGWAGPLWSSRYTGAARLRQARPPFPLGVGAQLAELARGVLTGPRGLRARIFGPRLSRGRPLVSLRGLSRGLVASVVGGADEGLGFGPGPLDRLPCLCLGMAGALP